MLQRTVLLFAFIAMIFILGCGHKDGRIVGKWKFVSSEEMITFTFDKNNRAVMAAGNTVMGGENYMYEGERMEMLYDVDWSANPYQIDLSMQAVRSPRKHGFMKGIFRFLTDTKIEMRMGHASLDRFEAFDSNDKVNTMIFEKVSQ